MRKKHKQRSLCNQLFDEVGDAQVRSWTLDFECGQDADVSTESDFHAFKGTHSLWA